ncbi:ABC transporter permease [Humibacter sp. BT305]|uniref:Sugar ABC transporter permease n=1 Tax=Cnuibacter physcomitrellae TaxID=1619308 RepID=A0A1X9LL40_9MICO|nr:ABC transporter permease [Cnuibacter physcomitrellae]ARJ05192.1 sugar ABC transporter permease [Cnuibacter physcomitrellae]AXH36159.1 ABC transporter permease [Humibacter sp. BT305]GGI35157.1 ABC transporter permease [Cnuibacter physcomitrellae]
MHVFELGFVAAVLLAATPILYASLAGAISAQAGVFNIALEGQMLWGAFAGVAGSYLTGSAWGGLALAIVTTAISSVVLAVGAARWNADPIIIAIGANLVAVGLTGFLLRVLFGVSGTFAPTGLQGLPKMAFLADVPVIGPIFAGQTVLVPLAFVVIVAVGLWLRSTPAGLRLRGVGEHPEAATTLGIGVSSYRMWTVIVAGALCGVAGAQLSLGNVTVFTENMTAGRGWIAVAAVMLVSSRPLWLPLACLGFGAAEALGFRLQGIGAPQQLTDAAPYAITLVVLVLTRIRFTRRRDAVLSS